jgi:hypothetical protein
MNEEKCQANQNAFFKIFYGGNGLERRAERPALDEAPPMKDA